MLKINVFFVDGHTSSIRNFLDFQLTSVPECPKYDSVTLQIQYTSIENSDFRQPSVSLLTEDFDIY